MARWMSAARVRVVAAADLRAAFEQVPSHRGAGQAVPVVAGPAEMRQRRANRQRWVGDAAADHDLGPGVQRIGDRFGAHIRIGADDAKLLHRRADGRTKQFALCRATQVVTVNDGDARRAQAELARQLRDAPRCAGRVRRAEVADDAHAARQAARQHREQHLVEQRFVASVGVVAARQLRQCQRALGQRLEDQHGRAARGDHRVDHRAGRVGAVAREASCAADPQHHVSRHRVLCMPARSPA